MTLVLVKMGNIEKRLWVRFILGWLPKMELCFLDILFNYSVVIEQIVPGNVQTGKLGNKFSRSKWIF